MSFYTLGTTLFQNPTRSTWIFKFIVLFTFILRTYLKYFIIKTTYFTGPEYNMTQGVLKKKPASKRYNWINTTLVLVTTVFALVSLAYFVMQIVEKNMKREANV